MTFTKNEVWECYQFARQMRGKHNRSMIMDREIGKYSEMI